MHHTSDPTEACLLHPNLNQPGLWNPAWYWVLWFLKVWLTCDWWWDHEEPAAWDLTFCQDLLNKTTVSLRGDIRGERRDGKEESEGRWEKRKTVRKNKNREKEVDRTEQMKEIGCSTCASHEWCRLVLSHHMFYAAFSHHWTGRSTSHGRNGKHQPGQLKTKISLYEMFKLRERFLLI